MLKSVLYYDAHILQIGSRIRVFVSDTLDI